MSYSFRPLQEMFTPILVFLHLLVFKVGTHTEQTDGCIRPVLRLVRMATWYRYIIHLIIHCIQYRCHVIITVNIKKSRYKLHGICGTNTPKILQHNHLFSALTCQWLQHISKGIWINNSPRFFIHKLAQGRQKNVRK